MLGEGVSNSEIAGRPFITTGTAKLHVKNIPRSPGVATRAQAAVAHLAPGREHLTFS